MTVNIEKTLEALDFNAVHSGDSVAKAYFGMAAQAIRHLEGARDYYLHAAEIERQNNHALRTVNRKLITQLQQMRDRDGAEGGDANAAPVPQDRQARAEGIAQ